MYFIINYDNIIMFVDTSEGKLYDPLVVSIIAQLSSDSL